MVVKGGEGREILRTKYPFEQVPIEAVKEMENLKNELAVTLRDFFIASSSQGISPVMGVIESDVSSEGSENKKQLFKLAGSAIFKDLKLVGFLNEKETSGYNWLTDRMKNGRINANLPDGNGNVGILLNHANRRITTEINGSKIKMLIQLSGEGSLSENNSPLDVSLPKNLEIVQNVLKETIEQQVRDALLKVQKRYKVDSLGFGREIYRNNPKQWKLLKEHWEDQFPDVDVSIKVKLMVGTGMAGPPLQLKEEEIKK
ncbi:hypothetical protein ASG93_30620 [Paenibacillus sp. Soil787]|nr:hypothetical protein ASG93_30620 [Paenibacillus sp. Soil787]